MTKKRRAALVCSAAAANRAPIMKTADIVASLGFSDEVRQLATATLLSVPFYELKNHAPDWPRQWAEAEAMLLNGDV